MELEITLKKAVKILQKLKIPYLITGGVAVVVWGRPRYTADIDIIIELKKKLIKEFVNTLAKEGYVDEDVVNEALEHRGEFNFIDHETGVKVDFWISGNSNFDKSRLKRAVVREIYGQKVYFISPEDLILKKLLWFNESSSTRQLEDVQSIMQILKNKLDFAYLKKWAKKHKNLELLEEMMALVS